MNKFNPEILPLKGLPEIKFGDTIQQLEFVLGPPEETDELDDDFDPEGKTLVYHYWDKFHTFFFRGKGKPFLISIESDHLDTSIFDQKIFKMKEEEIVALFAENKFTDTDIEEEEWGEKRLSYEELAIDFYFEDGQLSTVNWSAELDDFGDVVLTD
ncbi:MAG: hypothetical protein Q7J34_06990 [Bacteroidales bacterium]|nr:hypothetical protein [Bacteroidales bacterium]